MQQPVKIENRQIPKVPSIVSSETEMIVRIVVMYLSSGWENNFFKTGETNTTLCHFTGIYAIFEI